jgi:hypothetical protein
MVNRFGQNGEKQISRTRNLLENKTMVLLRYRETIRETKQVVDLLWRIEDITINSERIAAAVRKAIASYCPMQVQGGTAESTLTQN